MVCLFEEPKQVFLGVFLLKASSMSKTKKNSFTVCLFSGRKGQGWNDATVIWAEIIDEIYPLKLKIKREMSWLKFVVYSKK